MLTTTSNEITQGTKNPGASFEVKIIFVNGHFTLMNSQIIELYFIEDIFSPFISGKLSFIDSVGLLEYGPLTGNESILVTYTGQSESDHVITKEFTVFKIGEVTSSNNSNATDSAIELFFMDPLYSALCIEQYSHSWKDKRGDEIIKEILTNIADIDEKYLDTNNEAWEESTDTFENYYMPWWTCLQSIKWLLKRMKSKKSETSGYLFYANTFEPEERDGISTLNLKTLDTLLANTSMMKISDSDDSVYTFSDSQVLGNDKNRIFSYTMDGVDKSAVRNLAGGHYYGFDSAKKEVIDLSEEYTYAKMLEKHTVLGNNSLFMDISLVNAGRKFTGEEDSKLIDNIAYDDWVKRYVMQNYMHIIVDGHEKRYAGGLIEVNFPPRVSKNSGATANLNLSGKYLIKTITHYFNPSDSMGYRQKMVLIKNGYDGPTINALLPATKKNIIAGNELGSSTTPSH